MHQITIDNSFIAWGRDKSRRKPEPPSLWWRLGVRSVYGARATVPGAPTQDSTPGAVLSSAPC